MRFKARQRLAAIVMGWPGSGKTHFGASFNLDERTSPALMLNASGNPEQVLDTDPGLVVWNMAFSQDIDLPFNFLAMGQPEKHRFREACELPPDVKFKSVVVDTLTDWQLMKAVELLQIQHKQAAKDEAGNPLPTLSTEYLSNISAVGQIKPAFWQDLMLSTINTAQGLISKLPGINVIMLLQLHNKIDFSGGAPSVVPWLLGQSRDALPGWVRLVAEIRQAHLVAQDKGKVLWPNGKPATDTAPFLTTIPLPGVASPLKNQLNVSLGRGVWVPTATKILNLMETQ